MGLLSIPWNTMCVLQLGILFADLRVVFKHSLSLVMEINFEKFSSRAPQKNILRTVLGYAKIIAMGSCK